MYGAPLFTVNVSLRDGKVSKDNFNWKQLRGFNNILVVDDINDSGKTLDYVFNQCYINDVICPKSAVLLSKQSSKFKPTFIGEVINKEKDDEWIVFPWE